MACAARRLASFLNPNPHHAGNRLDSEYDCHKKAQKNTKRGATEYMYVRFIVQTDQKSRTRCSGVIGSYADLKQSGELSEHDQVHGVSIIENLESELPVPPFDRNNWGQCVCWFKDSAKDTILDIRELVQILLDYDFQVEMLTEEKPGMIVYEDEFQVVSKSKRY